MVVFPFWQSRKLVTTTYPSPHYERYFRVLEYSKGGRMFSTLLRRAWPIASPGRGVSCAKAPASGRAV